MHSADQTTRVPLPDRLIRSRCSDRLELGLRNLYILPSRFGWLWLLTCVVLHLLAITGASGQALLLATGALGLFLLAPFLTQANLQGLTLECGDPPPGQVGETVLYPLLAHSRIERLRVTAQFQGDPNRWSGSLPAGRSPLAIAWQPHRRGRQRPGRLRLETQAPLGLFVCWSVWEPAAPQLIAPARRRGPVRLERVDGSTATTPTNRPAHAPGSQEWCDLGPHRPEEGSSRIAWKQLAHGGERLSKRFEHQSSPPLLLSPEPGLAWEQALEHLCDHCHRLLRADHACGLRLGAMTVPPGRGERQLQRCLEALALAPADPP